MSRDETIINPNYGYAPLGHPQPQHAPPPPHANYAYNNIPAAGVPSQGTTYYASAQLPPAGPPEPTRTSAHARVALILLILLVCGTLVVAILTWLVFGDNYLHFKIQAFSVPYFNVTHDSGLEAKWETNITAKNPTRKLDVFLGEVEGDLEYRGVPLDSTLINSLHVGMNSEGLMRANFSVLGPLERNNSASVTVTETAVMRQMEDDRKSGSAVFDLRMVMEATFTSSGTVWSKRSVIRVLCKDIKVIFQSPTGGGTWNGEGGDCLTYS